MHKRYLIHVAGYNLGLIMRLLVGAGTPRELLAGNSVALMMIVDPSADVVTAILLVGAGTEAAMLVITCAPEPTD